MGEPPLFNGSLYVSLNYISTTAFIKVFMVVGKRTYILNGLSLFHQNQKVKNLAACGGTFLTGLTRLTRFSLYPEHPVYPV